MDQKTIKYLNASCLLVFTWLMGDERGAELRTIEPALYGKFEARYKPAQGEGLVSSFFVYNDDYPNTPWVEIDIELLGRFSRVVDMNTMTPDSHLRTHYVSFNTHLDFYVYGFEWTPDYVAWFINGQEVYRQTGEHVTELNHPAKIMMNIWNPIHEDWVGVWDERVLPRFAYYDWVRYASYTPGSGDTGTNNDFTHQWQDEFVGFDTTRWEKSDNHTWNGNQSTFIKENAVIQDGHLILCLTDDEHIGYQDQTIPYVLWARAKGDSVTVRFSEELDPVSSQNENNFVVTDATVLSAPLKPDQRTVKIVAPGMEMDNSYNLTVLGIDDDSQPPNTQMGQWLPIDMPQPLSFPLRVNSAGGAHNEFLSDQLWSSGVEYGHMNGNYQITDQEIANADHEEDLYHSSLNRVVSYKVRFPNGVCSVTLKFSENHYSEPNQRTFDIFIEDSAWISELDIFALAGQFNAFDTTLSGIIVNDGILDLYFSAVDYGSGYEYAGPFLSAMVVEQDSTFELRALQDLLPQKNQIGFFHSYPNPFNPSTTFHFSVSKPGKSELNLYAIGGHRVLRVFSGYSTIGDHLIEWSRSDHLSSGLYIARLTHNSFFKTKRVLIIK